MTPAPTPSKTVKKVSPLATLLAYIQRQGRLLAFITLDLFLDFYIYLYCIFRDKKIVERLFAYVQRPWHLLSIVARWMHLMLTKDNLRAYLRRHWRLLALLILYIFFRPPFEEKLASLLQFFDPSWGSFIVWLGIIGILIALVCTHSLGYEWYLFSQKYSKSFVAILFGLWAYYHWGKVENYETIPTPIPGVYYMDIFLVLCACLLIVRVRSYREERCRQRALRARMRQAPIDGIKEGYQIDQPNISKDEDLLGRRAEAESLAEKIFKTDTSKGTFTLGLTAPWGAGKTSFMLVMREYLGKKPSQEVIVMAFNPWMYRKAPNLTQVFFEELSRTLAPYNSDLASAFIRYVRSLLAQESNAWLQLVARLLPQESNEKSITEQYESLSQEICRLGRKIFIFIDDVDRLEGKELVELFALVRNSSSFPCMSYILAYDKEYVASQLKGCYDQHTHRYMEKILQEEYALAQITPEVLEKNLAEGLVELGPMYASLSWDILCSINIIDYLPTFRAVKRFCNRLSSLRGELEENVNLFDWTVVELIRLRYPDLFELLKNSYEQSFYFSADCVYMSPEMGGAQIACYKLESSRPLTRRESVQKFRTYLQGYDVDLQWREAQQAFILMDLLWGEDRELRPLQVNHRLYIGRYFAGVLRLTEISEEEFRENMSSPFTAIKAYLNDKLHKGQLRDFAYKLLRDRDRIDSAEMAEKYLHIALYIDSIGCSEVLFRECEISSLIESLKSYSGDSKEYLREKLKGVFSDPDLKLGVILYLSMANNLHAPTYERLVEMYLIMQIFEPGELIKLMEERFWEYVQEVKYDPVKCYLLWRECRIYEEVEHGTQIFYRPSPYELTQMNERVKKIIEGHVEKLIPYFIQYAPRSSSLFELLLPEPIWSLDKQESNSLTGYFPDFIFGRYGASSSSSSVIKEFQSFLTKWLSREEVLDKLAPGMPSEMREKELRYISFNFKHIQPVGITPIIHTRKYL